MFSKFYYIIYKNFKNTKTNTTPALNALIILLILQTLNLSSIYMLLNYHLKLYFTKNECITGGVVLFIILFIPNYIFLMSKIDTICKRYENDTKLEKIKSIIYFALYIVVSVGIFSILGE